jgi:hypothetical protein
LELVWFLVFQKRPVWFGFGLFKKYRFGLVLILQKKTTLSARMRSFGSILNLVGGSTVTLLTFVFPPLFYMRLADASLTENGGKAWIER